MATIKEIISTISNEKVTNSLLVPLSIPLALLANFEKDNQVMMTTFDWEINNIDVGDCDSILYRQTDSLL